MASTISPEQAAAVAHQKGGSVAAAMDGAVERGMRVNIADGIQQARAELAVTTVQQRGAVQAAGSAALPVFLSSGGGSSERSR